MLVSFQQQLDSKQRDHWELNPHFDSNRHVPPEQSIHRTLESVPKALHCKIRLHRGQSLMAGQGTSLMSWQVLLHCTVWDRVNV